MSDHTQFEELQSLIDQKAGDFKKWYKIVTDQSLTIYGILNSPRVEGVLKSGKTPCDPLAPGQIRAEVLKKRMDAAIEFARSPVVQNGDGNFTNIASSIFSKAREILSDAKRSREYREWLEARHQSTDERRAAAEAAAEELRRKAREEEKRRQKAEKRARELEKQLQEQKEAEERRKQAEAGAAEVEPEPEPEPPSPAPKINWLRLLKDVVEGVQTARAASTARNRDIDVTGAWSSYDGLSYYLSQSGTSLTMRAANPLGVVVQEGSGEIVGNQLSIALRALTPLGVSNGHAQGQVSSDGRNIRVSYRNFSTGQSGMANLFR